MNSAGTSDLCIGRDIAERACNHLLLPSEMSTLISTFLWREGVTRAHSWRHMSTSKQRWRQCESVYTETWETTELLIKSSQSEGKHVPVDRTAPAGGKGKSLSAWVQMYSKSDSALLPLVFTELFLDDLLVISFLSAPEIGYLRTLVCLELHRSSTKAVDTGT